MAAKVAALAGPLARGALSRASLEFSVVARGKRGHRSMSCDSAQRCIFRGRTGRACDAAANCHAFAAPPLVLVLAWACPRPGAGLPTRSVLRPICSPSPVPRFIIRRELRLAKPDCWFASALRGGPLRRSCIAAKRQGRTLLTFIAFQAADLLPAMRASHDASAQRQRIARRLIGCR